MKKDGVHGTFDALESGKVTLWRTLFELRLEIVFVLADVILLLLTFLHFLFHLSLLLD